VRPRRPAGRQTQVAQGFVHRREKAAGKHRYSGAILAMFARFGQPADQPGHHRKNSNKLADTPLLRSILRTGKHQVGGSHGPSRSCAVSLNQPPPGFSIDTGWPSISVLSLGCRPHPKPNTHLDHWTIVVCESVSHQGLSVGPMLLPSFSSAQILCDRYSRLPGGRLPVPGGPPHGKYEKTFWPQRQKTRTLAHCAAFRWQTVVVEGAVDRRK